MAEKTFTEKQREIVARKMGYEGPMQMFDEYLNSSPSEARKYALIGTKFMARGGAVSKNKKVRKFAEGGTIESFYQSSLGRAPDPEGLAYWQSQAAQGVSMDDIAKSIANSPEAMTMKPASATTTAAPTTTTTAAPVTAAAPTTAPTAKTFTDAQVASYLSTNPNMTPQQVSAMFAISPQQMQNAQALLSSGSPSVQQATDAYKAAVAANPSLATENTVVQGQLGQVATLYTQGLNRNPDPEGLAYWQSQLAKGVPITEVRAAFNATPEKQIVDLYRTYLQREADPAGLQYWLDAIKAGASIDEVKSAFTKTPEFLQKNPTVKEIPKVVPPTTTPTTTPSTPTESTDKAGPKPTMPGASTVTAALTQEQAGQMVGTQLAPATAATATPAQAGEAATVAAPGVTPTATMKAATAAPQVQAATAGVQAAQGAVAPQAQVQAQQVTPTSTAVGQLQAAQGITTQVTGAPVRGEQVGEMVSGPAVNMAQVEQTLNKAEAAQGVVTEDMTVQGQLAKLTAGFESGNPPSWAAASLRNATAQMAARGLGASSLAGQAIIQATLEAALPIASADAQVFQQMGLQNLSNRQQMAVLTAQQRAQFLGQEFDQTFQTRVINATRVAEIANMNFTAQQQIALENARLAQSMDLANLTNRQAVVMAQAAQIANLETANLNNRQQAAVINAQSFLQMDMANLQNEQQTEMFKAQSNIQSILTDQAAENAARQFNASSQNQADQFFANLTTQVGQFNTQQRNAMSQFNTDQANTVARFNAEVQNQRDQFNAQNRLVIDQSNAQWRREIATANTAAINRANEFNATKAQELTMVEYNNLWQQFRDEIEYSWKSAENAADRINAITRAEIGANASILAATMAKDAEITKTIGQSAATILSGTSGAKVFGEIFNWGVDIKNSVVKWAGGLFDTKTDTDTVLFT